MKEKLNTTEKESLSGLALLKRSEAFERVGRDPVDESPRCRHLGLDFGGKGGGERLCVDVGDGDPVDGGSARETGEVDVREEAVDRRRLGGRAAFELVTLLRV